MEVTGVESEDTADAPVVKSEDTTKFIFVESAGIIEEITVESDTSYLPAVGSDDNMEVNVEPVEIFIKPVSEELDVCASPVICVANTEVDLSKGLVSLVNASVDAEPKVGLSKVVETLMFPIMDDSKVDPGVKLYDAVG